MTRYEIPAGTTLLVQKGGGTGWTMHTTRSHQVFERCESLEGGMYTFRHDDWLLRVGVSRVWRRRIGLERYQQFLAGMELEREFIRMVREW